MNDIDDLRAFYDLAVKLRSEEERVAKIRQRERRERKEKLYSYEGVEKRVTTSLTPLAAAGK
jgi:hypothetical protein